jgi:hypothetical protein
MLGPFWMPLHGEKLLSPRRASSLTALRALNTDRSLQLVLRSMCDHA